MITALEALEYLRVRLQAERVMCIKLKDIEPINSGAGITYAIDEIDHLIERISLDPSIIKEEK